MSDQPCIVIVDDEEMVLISLRAFLRLETDYDVREFSDPRKAAEFVSAQRVDVIISDYMMPAMNGIELLLKVKEVQPETTRILLTGYADKQSAVAAINEVGLFQYLEKPWENDQLLLVINNGLERSRLLRTLREKIGQLDSAHAQLRDVQSRLIRAFL